MQHTEFGCSQDVQDGLPLNTPRCLFPPLMTTFSTRLLGFWAAANTSALKVMGRCHGHPRFNQAQRCLTHVLWSL